MNGEQPGLRPPRRRAPRARGALASLPPLKESPLVSVVIPALNEERYIGSLLDSLEAQTYDHNLIEVLVAEGGSKDTTREIVQSRRATTSLRRVVLLGNPGRTAAHGLNTGAAAAEGDVIIVLGAHSRVAEDFVEENVRALRETGAAAAGGPITTEGQGKVASAIAAAMSHPFGVGDARFRFSNAPGYVDTIAFAAYRRECFETLSGFDEARDKGEDDLFNFRVRDQGGKLYLTPRVRSTYYSRAGFRGVASQYFGYGKAKGSTLADEPRALRPRHFVPATTLVVGGVLLAGSVVSSRSRFLLICAAAAYIALATLSAFRASTKRGHPQLTLLTGAVFPVLHVSYGAGMITALVQRALGIPSRKPAPSEPAAPQSHPT
jgi:succinoglycan biosynthesis protein ExoA